MSAGYNENLQQRLEKYIASGHSQEETARQIGMSGGLLSGYRKGTYNGNIENTEKKISEFFGVIDAGAASQKKAEPYKPADGYVPTTVSENVYQTIRYCQIEKGMVIIHGDAGIGKTKAAGKFVQDNPNASIYIQASPVVGSLGAFLKSLARTMHIPERRSKFELVTAIREALEGTNRVLIIDEAQHLKYAALEEIRTWGDANESTGKGGIGIVLIGNSEVYDRMLGKQEARFAQLFSRIRLHRLYTTRSITTDDVNKLFPLLAEHKQKQELDLMLGVCRSKWGVRGAVNVYNNAANNENVSYDGLLAMARSMGIGMV